MITFPCTAIIGRTSVWDDIPCEEAVLKRIPLKDTYWENASDRWTIELKSANDLLELMEKFDERLIIKMEKETNPPMLSIEIYDDWRE